MKGWLTFGAWRKPSVGGSHIHHGLTSPQPPASPHHVNVNPAANPQSAQFTVGDEGLVDFWSMA
jgi:hypothetical protein